MCMVGRADGDGVHLVSHHAQQLAVVMKQLRVRVLLSLLFQPLVVDIAERDNLTILCCPVRVTCSFAAHADTGHIDSLVG